jgi:hypothetical protein
MKLDLLKSVTFTHEGKTALPKSANLLVAAVGYSHQSASDFYVRDDEKNGKWVGDLVIKGNSSGGICTTALLT